MAGLGRKVFTAGQVLAAADVQGYLQDQAVQVYASSTARSTVVGTAVSEGMFSYLKASSASVDTANQIDFYNGSAWESIYTPGRNVVINGGFDFWQRGTSFSTPAGIYTADRWVCNNSNSGDSFSQQIFTPGSAPVSGYEGQFYGRITIGATAGTRFFFQKIEDVRTLAGQTATLSFWARVSTGTATLASTVGNQNFGSGGSAFVTGTAQLNTLTTSWQRFSQTGTFASIAGKTIGTGSNIEAAFNTTATNVSIDIWGVQLEAGSVATPFRRAGGTLQGELAACQRYYWRSDFTGTTNNSVPYLGVCQDAAGASFTILNPVEMRIPPYSFEYSNLGFYVMRTGANPTITAVTLGSTKTKIANNIILSVSGGLTVNDAAILNQRSTSGYLGLNAEL